MLVPIRRMISAVPQPSAVNDTIRASPDMLLRAVAVRHDRLQFVTIRGTYFNFDAGAHTPDSHSSEIAGFLNRTQM